MGRSDRGLNERAPFIGTDRFLKKLAVELRSLTWPRLHLFGVSSAPSSSNGLSAESFDQICTKGWEDALFAMRAYEFAAKAIGELAYRPALCSLHACAESETAHLSRGEGIGYLTLMRKAIATPKGK